MGEFLRLLAIGVLCLYALASTPFVVYFGLSALFNLITALKCRAEDASWLNPASWMTRQGYTRDGYQELTGFAIDVGKVLLALLPWGVLLYLAGH